MALAEIDGLGLWQAGSPPQTQPINKKQPASGLQQVKGRLFNRPAPQPGLMPSLVWPVERRQFLLERFIEQFMPMLAKKHK